MGEFDDQSFRAADVAEPIGVLVSTDLADRVKAVVAQSVDDRVEVITSIAMCRKPSRFAGRACGRLLSAGAWNLTSSSLPLPSGVRTIATSARRRSDFPPVRAREAFGRAGSEYLFGAWTATLAREGALTW